MVLEVYLGKKRCVNNVRHIDYLGKIFVNNVELILNYKVLLLYLVRFVFF